MKNEEKPLLPGGVTEEQMKEWEKKYGLRNDFIKRGSLENLSKPGEKLYFYFRKPDKNIIALALARGEEGGKKTPLKSGDIFRQNCLLFAEEELTNSALFKGEYEIGMAKIIGDAFPIPDGEIEKI
jgi:hypothetical protein